MTKKFRRATELRQKFAAKFNYGSSKVGKAEVHFKLLFISRQEQKNYLWPHT